MHEQVPAVEQRMLGNPNDTAIRKPETSFRPSRREWIPIWLRKSRALPLAAYCIVLLILLEVMNLKARSNHGIDATTSLSGVFVNKAVYIARYGPTIGIIALEFAWKAVSSDAKKATPWSSMSQKWTKSSHSILLDYVGGIEVLEVIPAARRKHWAVLVALVFSFVCGAMVALSNALTFVDVTSGITDPLSMEKTTQFEFDGALEDLVNHNLTIPLTYLSQKPYAMSAAEIGGFGKLQPFMVNPWIFESFTSTSEDVTTLQATVQAFRPGWQCDPLNYTVSGASQTLIADASDLNCFDTIEQDRPQRAIGSPAVSGWLNVTSCNADADADIDDLRLLATLVVHTNSTNGDSILGAMCSFKPVVRDMIVRVSTAVTPPVVRDYRPLTSSVEVPVDVKTSMHAWFLYLNNPLDDRTQAAFSNPNGPNGRRVYTPVANLDNVTRAAAFYANQFGTDPFTTMLLEARGFPHNDSYLLGKDEFASNVAAVSDTISRYLVSEYARVNATEYLSGYAWQGREKLAVRQYWLRLLQVFLALVAVFAVLEVTWLRPRTMLREDPGPLASTAVVLAASDNNVETVFAREAISAESHMRHELTSTFCRLQPSSSGAVALELTTQDSYHTQAVPTLEAAVHQHSGYRPAALRIWARIAIAVSFMAIMVLLAVLQFKSEKNQGLCLSTRRMLDVTSIVPTIVLLLLGYACSGVDSVVRSTASYNSLWKMDSRKIPLQIHINDYPSIWVPFRAIRNRLGISVAATSSAILLIPIVKIVAVGLYVSSSSAVLRNAGYSVTMNLALLNHLSDVANTVNPDALVRRAMQISEWAVTPSIRIWQRPGVLVDMVFSQPTDLGRFVTSDVTEYYNVQINSSAIQVTPECAPVKLPVVASYDGSWSFAVGCSDPACQPTPSRERAASRYFATAQEPLLRVRSGGNMTSRSKVNRYQGTTYYDERGIYWVILGDFASIGGNVFNVTAVNMTAPYIVATNSTFNVPVPSVVAVQCAVSLNQAIVNATFANRPILGGPADDLQSVWQLIDYDPKTIVTGEAYDTELLPSWLAPPAGRVAGQGNFTTSYLLNSPTLFPTQANTGNFFELIAVYAQHKLRGVQNLLNPQYLAMASMMMYQMYTTNLLAEVQRYATSTTPSDFVVTSGTMAMSELRLQQDRVSAIVLNSLLFLMFLCFLWVFCRYPVHAVLPKNPGSLAARFSLLANSELIRFLRMEEPGSFKDSHVLKEKASLGWWSMRRTPSPMPPGSASFDRGQEGMVRQRSEGMRWGIDTGSGVIKRSWWTTKFSQI